jgi:hypothetical protein
LRKFASIGLLLILLFNIAGYRAWFYYAEEKADVVMESRLDKDQYDESELLSLTIPLNDPYLTEQTCFERTIGEINLQGKTYRFVKRKISDGNLVLLCLPDARKTVLKKASTEFGSAASGLAGNKNSSRTGTQKLFSGSDYIKQFANLEIWKFENKSVVFFIQNDFRFSDPHIESPGKPPQHVA